jgi:vancomycin permeability regulator SanA
LSGHGHSSHDEHESHFKVAKGVLTGVVALAAARGLALFLGGYTAVSAIVSTTTDTSSDDLWWIDFSFLPEQGALWFALTCSAVLLVWALLPAAAKWRQWLTAGASAALAAAALENIGAFYRAWDGETFQPGFVFPFCVAIAVLFGVFAWAALTVHPEHVRLGDHVAMFAGLGLMMVVFQLLVAVFYGSSDYRTHADAAVVFGGRIHDDGTLSPALRDRTLTAVEMYKSGLVDTLVFSGGAGLNKIEQAKAMREYAVRHGVSSSAILVDNAGEDLDTSIKNTAEMFSQYGLKKVLAVNQGYRLHRIKLAYLALGLHVLTVPAEETQPNMQAPVLTMQETPYFWQHWFEVVLGSFESK